MDRPKACKWHVGFGRLTTTFLNVESRGFYTSANAKVGFKRVIATFKAKSGYKY